MGDIIVTVRTKKSEVDLKLSGTRQVGVLLKDLGVALGIDVSSTARMQAEPAGKILNNQQSLLEQDIYNGSVLTII